MKAAITGIGACVPERRMSNDELSTLVDTSDEWIFSHTGIRTRHLAADGEACSDLAVQAGRRAIEDAGIGAEDVGMILVATASPDYIGFPSTACIVQDRLGATRAAAMDISAACTGFVYGLETARAFIAAGSFANVLVIGAEVLSRITNWKDRNTCVLFGDGAGAALVGARASASHIVDSVLFAQGQDYECLIRPAGGSRRSFRADSPDAGESFIVMDGKKVYMFAVNVLGKTIEALLQRNGLRVEDIDWIVPHQANVRIIEACAKRLGLSMDKFFVNIDEYANTSAASIPIAFADMRRKNLLHHGQKIITVGFGGGLTYGGNYIIW